MDSDYFRAGHLTDGTQVLIGRWNNDVVCVRFSSDGQLIAIDREPSQTTVFNFPDSAVEILASRIGLMPGAVHVQAFDLIDPPIAIRELPDYLKDYIQAPNDFPADRAIHLATAVEEWRKKGAFVLIWGEDYEMSRDGDIESS